MWNNIPRYQVGSYIPGLSSQIFGAGLSSDVRETQEDLYGKGSKLGERSFYDKIGGMFGSRGGKALAKWGMGALGVTNPWLKLAIPALGAVAGAYGIPKLFSGKDKKYKSKTGLMGSQYDKLSKFQDRLGEERKGRAIGYGLEGLYEGLKSDVGKELWSDVQSKYGWGEYGKAAEVDPSQALKNIGKLPSPPQLGMESQPPMMEDWEDFSKGGFGKGESMFKGSLDIDKPYSDIDFMRKNTGVLEGLGKEMPSGTEPELFEYMSAKLGSENPLDVNFLPTGSDFSPDEYPMEYPSSVESSGMPQRNLLGMIGSGTGHMGDLLTQFLSKQNINFGNAGKGQVWPRRYWQSGGPVGMQEGGSPEVGTPEMYTSMVRKLINKLGGEEPKGMYTPEGGLTREGYADMLGADPESISIDTLSFQNPANYMFKVSGKGAQSGADVGGTTRSRGVLPLKGNILDPLMRERIEDPFERMDMEMLFREIQPEGYQEGGMAYPLQMAGGGYLPEQGFGGLIQHRKGY